MSIEKVLTVEHFNDKLFKFTTTKPEGFKFTAGQFVTLGLPSRGDDVSRAYSMCSAPDEPFLEFYSIKVPDGDFTKDLQRIVPGDEIEMSVRPVGSLIVDWLKPGKRLWLMATGTGIAPFVSIVRDTNTFHTFNDVRVVHSTRTWEEQVYADEIENKWGLAYYPVITGRGDPRITEWFKEVEFNPEEDRIMLCGNEAFNKEMRAMLKEGGWTTGNRRELGTFAYEKAFAS